MNDRMDDAWSVIIKLHGVSQNDTTSAAASFAREEFYQMKQQAVADKATASGESFGTLFTKPSYRKRMLCAFFTMFASESTGILVVYSEFRHRATSLRWLLMCECNRLLCSPLPRSWIR